MPTLDIFNGDAFSAASLSAAIEKMDYVPHTLDSLPGLVVQQPVRTETIWIEERSYGPVLIPFTPRGTAPHQTGSDPRKTRGFKTARIADQSRIYASEIAFVRQFGEEMALKTVQEEVSRRQMKLKQNYALTKEAMLLGMVQGLALDPGNGGATLYDWAAEFNQAIPAEIDFDLDNASPVTGALRKKCLQVARSMKKGLKGVGVARRIVGLAGDAFYDDLISHPEVEKTYLNWSAAADLRNDVAVEWSTFRYGGIDWINYRGTDDGTTVGINTDQAKFFPVGAGIFQWALSPGERMEDVGTLGQESYSMTVRDKDRDMWEDVEFYSYPLPVCTMPGALAKARRT